MNRVIIIREEEWKTLLLSTIPELIFQLSQKGYGFKMVSRETGEELDQLQFTGFFALIINKIQHMVK